MDLLHYITKRIFIAIALCIAALGYINAQVAISSDISPKEGALLDLNQGITDNNEQVNFY